MAMAIVGFNRYKRKPVTQKQRENMAHGQKMLEMAHARELLATWHWREDTPERRQWLRDALARTEKVYGPGAPERVRKYMRVIQDDNDSIPVHIPKSTENNSSF